jgi:hypothetical protein
VPRLAGLLAAVVAARCCALREPPCALRGQPCFCGQPMISVMKSGLNAWVAQAAVSGRCKRTTARQAGRHDRTSRCRVAISRTAARRASSSRRRPSRSSRISFSTLARCLLIKACSASCSAASRRRAAPPDGAVEGAWASTSCSGAAWLGG